MAHILKNSYPNTKISELYLKVDIADVDFVFKNGGETIQVPAHKTILASGSSVFRAMFFGLMPEQKTIEIVDASAPEFQEFLQLFYLSSVSLTIKNMDAVIRLADKYDVSDCLIACFENADIGLRDKNVLWAFQWAVALNNEHLQELCLDKCNGTFLTKEIFKSNDFLNCSQSMLEQILHAKYTTCTEIDIFNACLAWSKSLCREKGLDGSVLGHVKEQLGNCFYLIRFGAMSQKEISTIMAENSDLFSRNELVELLSKDRMSSIFKSQPRKNMCYTANKNSKLVVERRLGAGGTPAVKFPQSVFFSSNACVVLGKFECAPIAANAPDKVTFHYKIVKYDSVDRKAACTTLHKGKLKYRNGVCPIVELTKTIIIKPNKMYKIRCWSTEKLTYRIRNSWRNDGATYSENGAVKIMLYKYATNGIVSSMHFKPI